MAFRKLRRQKNAISDERARRILCNGRRAVLAVNGDDGYPYAVPVNYIYVTETDTVYFHGAAAGHKADALRRCDKVCLTVMGEEETAEGEWAPYVCSTVAFGRCRQISPSVHAAQMLRALAEKYYPSAAEVDHVMDSSGAAAAVYEIEIEHICGKRIQEK